MPLPFTCGKLRTNGNESEQKGDIHMDLKTFAVHRKLETDSPLLRYVMCGKDIPIRVVEENFRDYLEPLTDRVATRLIEDYAGLIGDEIPVMTQRREDGGYAISGEIPDRLVEAIQLVHEVTPEEIVSALVNHNTEMVHGQALAITDIDLTEAARKTFLRASSIPKVETAPPRKEPSLFEAEESVSLPVKDAAASVSMEPKATEPVQAAPVMESALPPKPIDPMEAFQKERAFQEEEMYPEEPAAPEGPDQSDVFRNALIRIYSQFIADIKTRHLDQRLNLNLA